MNELTNAKSVPKHVSKRATEMTRTELGIVISVALTGFLLQILTVWYWHKVVNVPAVEQTNQEVSMVNGTLTTTTSLGMLGSFSVKTAT